ncbi:glycoside hydrolase family 10 protein, partial [Paenibacillus larvae]|uniref:glycoside hydrolase family 10 protein n=1 Tax=Paenibacillus larvae TaxID=1464 RepID=UPI0018D07510
ILDDVKQMGMNAVVVQVRPMADAFYPSEYAPWSEYLTGTQGKSPGYDPLAFMVEEAHKRNLEFHAWFNPYRISTQSSLDKLSANHPARQHPDWVVTYGGRLYFNPGLPEVKQYITNSVLEVVRNYDIDSVHLDDYFYPYPVSGEEFPDDAAFRTYGNGFSSKADWRRDNVNQLVRDLSHEIKSAKTYVKFGISPFGVWRNKSSDPNGSDTRALSSYEAQFADTRKWVKEEWLDYIAPQVYWSFDFSAAQYNKVTDWWIEQTQGKNVHLYIGHAAYKVGDDKDPAWNNPDEIPNQIKYNTERFNQVKGSVFFSYKDLKSNRLGIRDRLIQDLYRCPALIPAMPWIEAMNRTLQLTDWQWKQLYDNMGEAWNAGKFTDWGWMVKIENHTLTVDEFAWLNNHILANSL